MLHMGGSRGWPLVVCQMVYSHTLFNKFKEISSCIMMMHYLIVLGNKILIDCSSLTQLAYFHH